MGVSVFQLTLLAVLSMVVITHGGVMQRTNHAQAIKWAGNHQHASVSGRNQPKKYNFDQGFNPDAIDPVVRSPQKHQKNVDWNSNSRNEPVEASNGGEWYPKHPQVAFQPIVRSPQKHHKSVDWNQNTRNKHVEAKNMEGWNHENPVNPGGGTGIEPDPITNIEG